MPVDISCRQIFLASPGGLDNERKLCRKIVRKYNETQSLNTASSFYVQAWEDVSGGLGRPQSLINPKLDECDFVLMLFHDWWGSPPDHGDRFSSGTEEEFFRALELLATETSPMRDMLVLFKTVDPARVRDAGRSLQAVLDFRARLEASKSLMYENFDSESGLRRIVERKLEEWAKPLGNKEVRQVEIPEAKVDTVAMAGRTREELLEAARAFHAERALVQAEAAFAAATADQEPSAVLEFAQFMRRTGRMEQAMTLNREVVTNANLLVSRSAHDIALRVRAMSNIGIIERKQGEIANSLTTLREAVDTARSAREPVLLEKCYALDNYGLSQMRAGDSDLALEAFEEADEIRSKFGSADERAQSAINLGRQRLSRSEPESGIAQFERALTYLSETSDQHLRANALCGLAESLIGLDRFEEAEVPLEAALTVNDQLQNLDGLSIVHCLWAKSLLYRGLLEQASSHIAKAADITETSGNVQGLSVLVWLRAEAARQAGDFETARTLLANSEPLLSGNPDPGLDRDMQQLRQDLQSA